MPRLQANDVAPIYKRINVRMHPYCQYCGALDRAMTFTVIDKRTGQEADMAQIALKDSVER